MKIRQVITGHDNQGQSIFIQDRTVPAQSANFMPGLESFELWSTEAGNTLPHRELPPGVPRYFPRVGGSVFRIISFPPQINGQTPIDSSDESLNELQHQFPGLLEHLELDTPGMHTTDSIDYGLVLKGEITLELDNGKERPLGVGDCVIQNGTRHAWHNRSSEAAVMAFVLIGTSRP